MFTMVSLYELTKTSPLPLKCENCYHRHFLQTGQVRTWGTIEPQNNYIHHLQFTFFRIRVTTPDSQLQKYHTHLDNVFCRFLDIQEHIFNCYMVGVSWSAVKKHE